MPLALILLAVLPFLPSVAGDFIEDDRTIIRDRIELRDPSNIPALFAQTYWPRELPGGLYRPLTMASYAIDRVVFGVDATGAPSRVGVHVGNLILNAIAVLLLFGILRVRSGDSFAAFLGAALFAVHPVHVEAVSHMVGRADLLMTVFFLAAFALHSRGAGARWAASGLYLLACFCKESAVVLPGVLFVGAWLGRSDVSALSFARRQAVELAPQALALALFIALRGIALGASSNPPVAFALHAPLQYLAFPDPAPFEIGLTMTHALGEILRLLVAPLSLSADYSGFPHATRLTPEVARSAGLIGVVMLAACLAWRGGRRDPLFWLAFFALAWLPTSNLFFASGIVMAERVLYLPSVALAGLATAGLAPMLARDRRWLALPLLAIAAFTALSGTRAAVWTDARTLHENSVAHGRYSGHIAKTGLVTELLRELGEKPDAPMLERALALSRAALDERPTTTSLRQVAALEEASGELDSALDRRTSFYLFDPTDLENRDALLRVLDRLIARHQADLYEVLSFTGTGYLVAQGSEEGPLLNEWRGRLDRAYERYIEEAIASGDADETRRRVELLAGTFPQHPLLERYSTWR